MRPCDVCGDAAYYAVTEVARDFDDPIVATCWACHDAGFADRVVALFAELRRESFNRRLVAPPVPQAKDAGPLFQGLTHDRRRG